MICRFPVTRTEDRFGFRCWVLFMLKEKDSFRRRRIQPDFIRTGRGDIIIFQRGLAHPDFQASASVIRLLFPLLRSRGSKSVL